MTNWSVLENEGVAEVIERAARRVAGNPRYANATEYDDLVQEGRILVATEPDLLAVVDEPGLLHHRLVQDLSDLVKTAGRRRDRTVSYDELIEGYCE